MTSYRSRSAFSFLSSISTLAIFIAFAYTFEARAMDPDIPKIQAGAERGSIAEEIRLGAAYLAGRGVPRDAKQAAYWYEKAANSGDPGAQLEVGYFYQAGIGVDRNPSRAAQWFERSASSGLTSAKVNLGVAYVWGLGVRKDPEFGAQLFKEAAKRGDGAGACYLGDMYYFGVGLPRDVGEGKHWFEVGSKLHNPMAKFNLAMMLLGQTNHSRDREAIRLLHESSQAGYVKAKHQLGLLMVRYPILAETPGEAVSILDEAAADGSWKSSVVLGILARDGTSGLAQDRKKAYYHFKVAALQGGDSAEQLVANDLRKLQSAMTNSEILSLDSEAAAWVSKHSYPLQFANIRAREPQDFPAFALEYPDSDAHAGMLIGAPIPGGMQTAASALRLQN